MRIIFDTNVLRTDFLLGSNNFRILIDFVEKTASTIVLPEIVLEELLSLYKKELYRRISQVNKSLRELNQITLEDLGIALEINVEKEVEEYRMRCLSKLGSFHLERVAYKDSYLKDIVKRSIERIKPMSAKGEEFRDSILWLTILDYLQSEKGGEVIFISSDIKDFGNSDGSALHSDLRLELNQKRLELQYYRTLNDFLQDFAVHIDYINKNWLVQSISWDQLDKNAKYAVNNIHDSYFFEYHLRHPRLMDNLHHWEVCRAKFLREIPMFFVHETFESCQYKIELHLTGIAEIHFENDESKITQLDNVEFSTQIMITVKGKEILEYKETYYTEETGLIFVK